MVDIFLWIFLEFFKKAPVRGSSYAENNALAVYCLNLFTWGDCEDVTVSEMFCDTICFIYKYK